MFSHAFSVLIVLFVFCGVGECGLGKYCGDWNILDWQSVPQAKPDDLINVYYLASPLLYCDYENAAELINGYHGAIGLVNTRSGEVYNLDYDAWPSFTGAIIPEIISNPDGSTDLKWTNFGGVFIYPDINKTYWHTIDQLVATMNGNQFNALIKELPLMNKTMGYYDLWTVYKSFPSEPLFQGLECFQWSFYCLAEIQRLGGKLVDGVTQLKQSIAVLFSDEPPVKLNASDPLIHADLVQFYSSIELKIQQEGILAFIGELWEFLLDGDFYIYDRTDYYVVKLAFPFFQLNFYPMPVPGPNPNTKTVIRAP